MNNDTQSVVRTCARPISLIHNPPSERAVVCLHGYKGYPGELALPAKRLYEAGFDVFVPRYPGHGTDAKDFLQTGKNDWIDEAQRVLIEAKDSYSEVSLIGHSMGGAIALILAERFHIHKVVLYAPALSIPSLPLGLVSILGLFVKKRRQRWQADDRYPFFDDRDASDDAYLGEAYWSWLFPRQLRQLGLLMREALKALTGSESDILVMTGGEDTVVDRQVGTMVLEMGNGRNNWIHLEKGTHLIPYDIDEGTREEAMERTVSWLSD